MSYGQLRGKIHDAQSTSYLDTRLNAALIRELQLDLSLEQQNKLDVTERWLLERVFSGSTVYELVHCWVHCREGASSRGLNV